MHKMDIIEVSKEDLLQTTQRFCDEKRRLVAINGYVNQEEKIVIAYNFDVEGNIKTIHCKGNESLPSIIPIYGASAAWFEEEITEMLPVNFIGLEKSNRLFLPEDFDGSGQILVMPLSELKEKNNIN